MSCDRPGGPSGPGRCRGPLAGAWPRDVLTISRKVASKRSVQIWPVGRWPMNLKLFRIVAVDLLDK